MAPVGLARRWNEVWVNREVVGCELVIPVSHPKNDATKGDLPQSWLVIRVWRCRAKGQSQDHAQGGLSHQQLFRLRNR